MIILGIDPGLSGGIAVWSVFESASVYPMPDSEEELGDFLRGWVNSEEQAEDCIAVVEDVPWIVAGRKHNAASRAKLHANAGFIRGVLHAHRCVRLIRAQPKEWQKSFGLVNTEKLSYSKWKNVLKAKAQELYPSLKVTLKTADALLLLEYGKRQVYGTKR